MRARGFAEDDHVQKEKFIKNGISTHGNSNFVCLEFFLNSKIDVMRRSHPWMTYDDCVTVVVEHAKKNKILQYINLDGTHVTDEQQEKLIWNGL